MEYVKVVLHNSVTCLGIKTILLGMSKATSKLENPTSTNNWQFPLVVEYQVPTQQAQSAPIEFPFREHKVKEHRQGNFLLVCKPVKSLSPSHKFGTRVGPNGQWVVRYHQEPEKRGWVGRGLCLCDRDCGGFGPARNVMEEEVKVEQLLLLETQRTWRYVFIEIGIFCCSDWGEE